MSIDDFAKQMAMAAGAIKDKKAARASAPAPDVEIDLEAEKAAAFEQNERMLHRHKGPLPDYLVLGTTIIANALHVKAEADSKNESKPRPYQVYGTYHDQQGALRAVDVLDMMPSMGYGNEYYSSNMRVSSAQDVRTVGMNPQNRDPFIIKTNNLFTIGNNSNEQGGSVIHATRDKIRPQVFPDLMLRRVDALLYSPTLKHEKFCDIDPSWVRTGIVFDQMHSSNISAAGLESQPDVAWTNDPSPCQNQLPDFLTADDVRAIHDHAIRTISAFQGTQERTQWPAYGQYFDGYWGDYDLDSDHDLDMTPDP